MSAGRRPGAPAGAAVVRVVVRDRDGLHARPCARMAEAALAGGCDVEVRAGGRTADGRSVFELLGLAAGCGAEIEVRARGPGAARCAAAVARAAAAAAGE